MLKPTLRFLNREKPKDYSINRKTPDDTIIRKLSEEGKVVCKNATISIKLQSKTIGKKLILLLTIFYILLVMQPAHTFAKGLLVERTLNMQNKGPEIENDDILMDRICASCSDTIRNHARKGRPLNIQENIANFYYMNFIKTFSKAKACEIYINLRCSKKSLRENNAQASKMLSRILSGIAPHPGPYLTTEDKTYFAKNESIIKSRQRRGSKRPEQLYCRGNGLLLKMSESGTVVGTHDSSDPYTKFIFHAVDTSVLQIQSVATGKFLTFNKRGKLIGKMKSCSRRPTSCQFHERVKGRYLTYFNIRRKKKNYLALSSKSKMPKRKSSDLMEVTHFLRV